MNRTEICNLVLGRLGRREGDTYLLAQAKSELTLVQERLEGGAFLPWFLLTAETNLTITAAVREVSLPADFLRECDDYPLQRYDATLSPTYKKLEKEDFDILLAEYDGVANGEPVAYALLGTTISTFPTADVNYTGKWRYYAKDDVLSDSVLTNQWTANAADLLVAELGIVMAGYARNQPAVELFGIGKAEAIKRLTAFDIARMQAARAALRGDRAN